MDLARLKRLPLWLPPLLALLIGAGLGLLLRPAADGGAGPDPVALADATLLSVREQGRLTVVRRPLRRGGDGEREPARPHRAQDPDHARQVRYGVDLSRLRPRASRLGRGDADADRDPAAP